MKAATEAAAMFDAAFLERAPGYAVRPEAATDDGFLTDLFGTVSPLRDFLPGSILAQQAAAANSHFRSAFPNAMQRIAMRAEAPVGRIIVDWTSSPVMGVDIAVLPAANGAGLAMLRAWLATADALARPCQLTVVRDNKARRIYARLGFRELASGPADPMVEMVREARSLPLTAS